MGSRAPAQAAYASASKKQTCCTGSSGGISSTRPNRRREPSADQNSGRARPAADPVLPAALRPPLRLVVAAGVDEALPLGVRDRDPADPERRQLHDVGGALVVEGPGLPVAVDAEDEGAGGHENRALGDRPSRRQRGAGPQDRLAVAELVGGQHRLDVLLLVLLDHHVGEQPLLVGVLEPVEDPAADVGDEAARLRRGQQRQRDPARPAGARTRRRAARPWPTAGPAQAALPPRSSQRSSCWPMWARSHTSGLIRGLCWVVSSGSSKSVSCRVRSRAASRPRAVVSRTGFLLEQAQRAVRLARGRAAPSPACAPGPAARRAPPGRGRGDAGQRRAATSTQPVAAARRAGSAIPRRAASSSLSATGSHSSAARSAASGSSTSVTVRAASAGHQRSGSASMHLISTYPRGRTGGNSVVRW